MFTFVLWPPIILKILFDLKTNPNDIGSPETVSKHSLNLSPVLVGSVRWQAGRRAGGRDFFRPLSRNDGKKNYSQTNKTHAMERRINRFLFRRLGGGLSSIPGRTYLAVTGSYGMCIASCSSGWRQNDGGADDLRFRDDRCWRGRRATEFGGIDQLL
ncbi:hypothetical protein QTP88_018911 [Uroleucon formosanum]